MKKTKNAKGITLIALVITIIVLLILAGITLNIALTEGGILSRAEEARTISEMAEIKERAELVKTAMDIEARNNYQRLQRIELVEGINEEFSGIQEGYSSIVEQGEYIVKVDKDLNIIVEKYTGVYLAEGEPGIILTPSTTINGAEVLSIDVEVKIGGMPPYEEYVEQILENKTQEEKEQYFVEYLRESMQYYFPEYEVNLENILKYYYEDRFSTLEELSVYYGCASYEDLLVEYTLVEPEEYENKKFNITLPNGTTATLNLLNPTSYFVVFNNGTYTVTGEYNGQNIESSIAVNNIKQKDTYVLAKEDQDTYLIDCIEDLVGLSNNVNNFVDKYEGKTIKLSRNLDFNDNSSYKNPNDTSFGDINKDGKVDGIKIEVTTGQGFTPIGGGYYISEDSYQYVKELAGNFDGNNKQIKNLYINVSANDRDVGLIGYATNIEIKNLNVSGKINAEEIALAREKGLTLGGIVGMKYRGSMSNCESNVNINVNPNGSAYSQFIGGLAGWARLNDIQNCVNNGQILANVSMDTYSTDTYSSAVCIGGIVGFGFADNNVQNCTNNGVITANSLANKDSDIGIVLYVGGIMGESYYYNDIQNCNNTGSIKAIISGEHSDSNIGGIVGFSGYQSNIILCRNEAELKLESEENSDTRRPYMGGICGYNNAGTVQKCANIGNITNSAIGWFIYVAGICGFNGDGTISQSYNIGAIRNDGHSLEKYDSACQIGGIVCSNSGSGMSVIENCYNAGSITNVGKERMYGGGICSYNRVDSKIINSYNVGTLTFREDGEKVAGAITYNAKENDVTNCYYLEGTYSKGAENGDIGTTMKTDSQMKEDEFVSLLNGSQTENIWKIVSGKNNGYPILSWQE